MTDPQRIGPQPGEGLIVTLKSPPLPVSWARLAPPVIIVNGRPLPEPRQGRNSIPAPPGRYRIHVHLRYLAPARMGPADHDADVAPGQWTEVEYKPPLWTLGKGSLGPPPQRYRGLIPILMVLAVSVVVSLLMLLIIL